LLFAVWTIGLALLLADDLFRTATCRVFFALAAASRADLFSFFYGGLAVPLSRGRGCDFYPARSLAPSFFFLSFLICHDTAPRFRNSIL
jgi:hypothetical protein